jgi:hypothetical protein
MHKIIHDVETGEITQIELTADEVAELQADAAKTAAKQNAEETERATKEAAKVAVLAKLGLTADEVAALLG